MMMGDFRMAGRTLDTPFQKVFSFLTKTCTLISNQLPRSRVKIFGISCIYAYPCVSVPCYSLWLDYFVSSSITPQSLAMMMLFVLEEAADAIVALFTWPQYSPFLP